MPRAGRRPPVACGRRGEALGASAIVDLFLDDPAPPRRGFSLPAVGCRAALGWPSLRANDPGSIDSLSEAGL
jgi:hypothetical protein